MRASRCKRAITGSGTCGNDAVHVIVIEDNGRVIAKIELCDFCYIWALDREIIPSLI